MIGSVQRHIPTDNSDDEKKIKKALKEAKSAKEEKLKAQRASRKSSSISKKHFSTMQCRRFLLSSQPRVQLSIADVMVGQGIIPNTAEQDYQAVDFLSDNFPTSPLQQHYQIKGFCVDQPNAILQPGDITGVFAFL